MRPGRLFPASACWAVLLSSPCAAQDGSARAGQEAAPRRPIVVIGRPQEAPACGGDRAACLDRRLKAVALDAQAAGDPHQAVPDATSPALRVGIGSVQGSSQRLGGDLRGATRLPQRPAPIVYPPTRSRP